MGSKQVFTIRAKFYRGQTVRHRGVAAELRIVRVIAPGDPMYETEDGRIFGEDEIEAARRRLPQKKGGAR